MMFALLRKEEYLRRYMFNESSKDKKKTRKKVSGTVTKSNVRIIDDDIGLQSLNSAAGSGREEPDDEAPTVAEFIDERPEHIQRLEEYRSTGRWKKLGKDEQMQDVASRDYGVIAVGSTNAPEKTEKHHGSDSQQKNTFKNCSYQSSQHSRHSSDSDHSSSPKRLSVPKSRRIGETPDPSPPRRKTKDKNSDQSPPRRKNKESDSDQSTPRRRKKGSALDQSPPRRRNNVSNSELPPSAKGNDIRPTKTLGGAKAGLSTAQEMKEEAQKLREREDRLFQKIDKDALGKDAKTVFRKKKRKFGAGTVQEEEDAKRQLALDEKYKEWGQGLKQKELKEQALHEAAHEMAKPLARYKDDEDLDRMMRELDREGDPMAAFLKKKTKQDESGKGRLQYKGLVNRFGIIPGHCWDGVDRSNGFEKQLISKMADKKSTQEQAFKWSVEDL